MPKLLSMPLLPPPYKHDKTLTEPLRILGLMKPDHHVDPHLFDAFIREKVKWT